MSQENQERPEPGTPEFKKATATAFIHFYRAHPELQCVANSYLLNETAKELGLDLITRADIQYVADYLGDALARIGSDPVVQVPDEPVVPPPTFEERRDDYETKLKAADSTTHRKLTLVSAMRSRGYTASQIDEGLQTHGFPPMTESEWSLLDPPAPNENSGEKTTAEFDSAAAHIGRLLGRGPVSAKDIKELSADETRKLLWPGGRGTPMSRENERAIDIILKGGR